MNVVLGKALLAVQIDVLPLLLRLQHDGSNWCITALSEPEPRSFMQKSIPSFMQKEDFSSLVCHFWRSWQMQRWCQQFHWCRTHLQWELVWGGQGCAHGLLITCRGTVPAGVWLWGQAEDIGAGSDAVGADLKLSVHNFVDIHGQRMLPFSSRAQHPPL